MIITLIIILLTNMKSVTINVIDKLINHTIIILCISMVVDNYTNTDDTNNDNTHY